MFRFSDYALKMNGIFALGHFCETHGPSVILCTQSLKDILTIQPPHILTVPLCHSCQSIDLNHAYLSKYENNNYISVRTALKQDLAFLLKQACVRSLSCEEETGKDGGTVYFGDTERGHVLSYTFRLPDSLARGFYRLFTIILLMKDKVHLLNSWPFVTTHLKKLIDHLKDHAIEINKIEQNKISQRNLRMSKGAPVGAPRNLKELTGIENCFIQIHTWFSWILMASSKETRGLNPILNPQTMTPVFDNEEKSGFVLIQYNQKPVLEPTEATRGTLGNQLRMIFKKLELSKFQNLIYSVLLGKQVIVRGPKEDVYRILNSLSILVPKKWVKKVDFSDSYMDIESCNFLGCGFQVAVPSCHEKTVRIDILNDSYHLKYYENVPEKVPTLLAKIMRAIQNELITDEILENQISVFVEEWSNHAQALHWASQKNSDEKLINLKQALGIQPWDLKLIQIWTQKIALYSK